MTIAVASSKTTSLNPSRRHALPDEPRDPSARPSRSSPNRTRTAGASVKISIAPSARSEATEDHAPVQADRVEKRHPRAHVLGHEAEQQLDAAGSRQQAAADAKRDEHERLRHELADQPAVRGAERAPDGKLALAPLRPHEQQADDVDAGDRQQQPGAAQEQQQDGPDVADDLRRRAGRRARSGPDSSRDTRVRAARRWPTSAPARRRCRRRP